VDRQAHHRAVAALPLDLRQMIDFTQDQLSSLNRPGPIRFLVRDVPKTDPGGRGHRDRH
jgi:hypothetical protein